MRDGSTCFVSRLVPDGRRATLEVEGWHRIAFAPRARLELRVFPRPTEGFFLTFAPPNSIALPAWPRFVLKTPRGLLAATANQAEILLEEEFRFMAGEHRVAGKWIHDEDTSRHLGDEDVFFYKIHDEWAPPSRRARSARVVTDLRDLGRIEAPEPTALELSFQLRSVRHGTIAIWRFAGGLLQERAAVKCSSRRKAPRVFPPILAVVLVDGHARPRDLGRSSTRVRHDERDKHDR